MKRKTLTTAVLAGLTGMAGMVSVSNAVNVNPDGLGQVLLYPFYTTRGGNDTLISIVNTTDNAKSVKVRFLESLNSREVLDFNLYMSEFDVWVAAITTEVDEGGDPAPGARLIIPDNSCTVPRLFDPVAGFGEQSFLPFAFAGDGGPQGIARVESGYIEAIEMGTLVNATNNSATAVTHVNGVPPNNCQQVVNAWSVIAGVPGYWLNDAMIDHEPPSGGLFGGASIIDPINGVMFSYNATAIDAFSSAVLHTNPASLFPNLGSGNDNSTVFVSGTIQEDTWDGIGIFAVNAVLTINTLLNEYVLGGSANARSEWVVTFPTKEPHVNGVGAPIPPFTSIWNVPNTVGGACEEAFFRIWDREEQTTDDPPPSDEPIVSPPPPPEETPEPRFDLCWEANVIRFGSVGDGLPDETEILGHPLDNGSMLPGYVNINPESVGFRSGWVRFSFNPQPSDDDPDPPVVHATVPSDRGVQYVGLPTIGFWVNTFTRNNLTDDNGALVRANYGGTFQHRGSRRLQLVTGD